METFSALLALCAGSSSVTGEFPAQRPVTRSYDVFFKYAWTNGWINDRDAGSLRRHSSHYDVTVMWWEVNIELNIGMMSVRQQAIVWTIQPSSPTQKTFDRINSPRQNGLHNLGLNSFPPNAPV